MKTLISSPNPYHLCSSPNPITHLIPSRPTTWKVHANAKGFSGQRKPPPPDKNKLKEMVQDRRDITGGNNRNDKEEDDQLPQVVLERMAVRMCVSVGAPLGTGVAMMKGLDLTMGQQLTDLPLWVQFSAILLTLGTSTLGLVYGALSTSWEEDKEGSFFGLEEAQKNWVEMWREE